MPPRFAPVDQMPAAPAPEPGAQDKALMDRCRYLADEMAKKSQQQGSNSPGMGPAQHSGDHHHTAGSGAPQASQMRRHNSDGSSPATKPGDSPLVPVQNNDHSRLVKHLTEGSARITLMERKLKDGGWERYVLKTITDQVRAEREKRQAAAKCQHPNVVKYLRAEEIESGGVAVEMEYLDLGSLSEVMLTWKQAAAQKQQQQQQMQSSSSSPIDQRPAADEDKGGAPATKPNKGASQKMRASRSSSNLDASGSGAGSSSRTLREPTPEERIQIARCIAFQVLHGMLYYHIVQQRWHRDIKPGNILLTTDGRVKLSDFDASRDAADSSNPTVIGTASYMAPECIDFKRDKGRNSDKVDVWSLGVVIVEIALGRHPFSSLQVLQFSRPMEHLSSMPWDDIADSDLRDLVQSMLKEDPEERISAAQALCHPFFHRGRRHFPTSALLASTSNGSANSSFSTDRSQVSGAGGGAGGGGGAATSVAVGGSSAPSAAPNTPPSSTRSPSQKALLPFSPPVHGHAPRRKASDIEAETKAKELGVQVIADDIWCCCCPMNAEFLYRNTSYGLTSGSGGGLTPRSFGMSPASPLNATEVVSNDGNDEDVDAENNSVSNGGRGGATTAALSSVSDGSRTPPTTTTASLGATTNRDNASFASPIVVSNNGASAVTLLRDELASWRGARNRLEKMKHHIRKGKEGGSKAPDNGAPASPGPVGREVATVTIANLDSLMKRLLYRRQEREVTELKEYLRKLGHRTPSFDSSAKAA